MPSVQVLARITEINYSWYWRITINNRVVDHNYKCSLWSLEEATWDAIRCRFDDDSLTEDDLSVVITSID